MIFLGVDHTFSPIILDLDQTEREDTRVICGNPSSDRICHRCQYNPRNLRGLNLGKYRALPPQEMKCPYGRRDDDTPVVVKLTPMVYSQSDLK